MQQPAQNTLAIFTLILLGGCASIESYSENTQHYRSDQRFDYVTIDVKASEQVATWPEEFSHLHDHVESALKIYLGRRGIEVSDPDDVAANSGHARLDVTIAARFSRYGDYSLPVKLTGADGVVIDETVLFHDAGSSSARATAQQLAEIIVDDMLLIWHPAPIVMGEKISTGPAPYALLPLSVEVDSAKHESHFRWEAFPSERLLQGTNISAANISDVSYDVRVMPYRSARTPSFRVHSTRAVYLASGLSSSEHTLPFTLPTCEQARWSVRAHFKLNGKSRVTEWSKDTGPTLSGNNFAARRHRSMASLSHQLGRSMRIQIDGAEDIKCHSSEKWPDGLVRRMEIDTLNAGQSIAAMALVSDYCDGERCEQRMTTEEASQNMAECLADEFKKSKLAMPVHDMATLLMELPEHPEPAEKPTDSDGMLAYFNIPENRNFLTARGVRYVVTATMSMKMVGKTTEGDSNLLVTVVAPETHYESTIDSSVFDIATGEVVAEIGGTAKGVKGVAVPMILFIPVAVIPYGSKNRMESRACDAMARRLTLALKGGVTGWPDGFFEDPIEPTLGYEVATQ